MANVEAAKKAIFTPNADEYMQREEMAIAIRDLNPPILNRLGGVEVATNIIMGFYKKLFSNEVVKYFFVNLKDDRARNMMTRFMGYLLGGELLAAPLLRQLCPCCCPPA